ncbi:MAG: permease prefix domain 1-containing protein [Humibacter sp.]
MSGRDRIDAYLDELYSRLRGDPGECRSMLAEAEAHLRDAAEASVAAGMDEDDAQKAAIAAFGSPQHVARAMDRHPVGAAIAAFAVAGGRLAAVGLVAVGLSAGIARLVAALTSTQWVYGAPTTYRFAAAQCSHWLTVQPNATDCSAAAAMENSDDSFIFTMAGVVVGLLLVGIVVAAAVLLRRATRVPRRRVPRTVVFAVGATAFGGAGLALLAGGIGDLVVRGHWGQGLWYVEAAVSLAFAVYFCVRLIAATSRSLTAVPAT